MSDERICAACDKPYKGRGVKYCSRQCAGNTKHGMCYTLEHRSWRNMIDRCGNPRCKYWPDYGGRGIAVCERWLTFANFYADMGPKPTNGKRFSIERIDNSKGYEPGNCRWATPLEQSRNRRCSYTAEQDATIRDAMSKLYSYKQMAVMLGKSEDSVQARAHRLGLKIGIRRTKQPTMGARP